MNGLRVVATVAGFALGALLAVAIFHTEGGLLPSVGDWRVPVTLPAAEWQVILSGAVGAVIAWAAVRWWSRRARSS
ncbi:MAG TPA: hypothetical protein VFI69_12260 [Candidatus Limnocylindrales bacterium]|nr:hypothetical protein [Candidatus Limnocylindrales bacterium]